MVSPQAGGLGRAVMLLVSKPPAMENILPGPEDAALDLGMMAERAGAGAEGQQFGIHLIQERSLGPRLPEPQIQMFLACEYFITDKTLLDKQRSPISPSVGVLWSPFPLLSLGGLGTH